MAYSLCYLKFHVKMAGWDHLFPAVSPPTREQLFHSHIASIRKTSKAPSFLLSRSNTLLTSPGGMSPFAFRGNGHRDQSFRKCSPRRRNAIPLIRNRRTARRIQAENIIKGAICSQFRTRLTARAVSPRSAGNSANG